MSSPSSRRERIVWHAAASEREWVAMSARAIEDALREALAHASEARLLLSGGSTPAPVHRRLASNDLDWARIVVGLVDDRDVGPDDDGSNARLVRETLLFDRAGAARFEPLRTSDSAPASAAAANARWSAPDIAVLGMGDDGHTASLFPGASNLDAALAASEPYVAIDASGSRAAGAFPRRISLTPAGLAQARVRVLLLRGEDKRAIFERALDPGDVRELPVRAAIDLPGAPLHVFWLSGES